MPPKRKRSDHRGPPDSGPSRPAPHRPDNTSLGQHDRGYDGGRAGGRNGRNTRRPDRRDSNQPYNSNSNNNNPNPPIQSSASRPPSSSSANNLPPINTAPQTPAPIPNTAAPTPVPPPQPTYSAPPSPIQPGYDYSIITDDRISRWSKGARQEVIDHGVQSRNDEDLTEVAAIFQELIHSAVDGRLPGSDAGKVIKDILGPEPSEADRAALAFDAHTLFLDTVATFMDVENAPFRPQLRDLMYATEVSTTLMRQVLDAAVLQPLGLVRETFVRVGIRQSTNLLYRQANYNLLREETEGYSKLVTELFTTSSAEPPSSEVVQAAFNKVMGLIGTFDLHPGRVLDVTLDVFASVLIKQFRFFIKFLRVSSWWPRTQTKLPPGTFVGGLPIWALPDHSNWVASEEEEKALSAKRLKRDIAYWDRARKIKLDAFFELGGRQVTTLEDEELPDATAESGQESSIEKEWIKITKTLPPTGNRDAAQMLGFKLRFYTTEARDSEDMLPANLLYLLALLIKVGFITLTDLWEHIWPPDDMMEAVKAARFKELEEKERANRPGGAANALMMAGALPDDMAPPPVNSRRDMAHAKADADNKTTTETVEEKPKLPEPDDQKVILLKCLLTIGAIPESLFIIGRHNWLLQAHPDLIPLVHRILHHSVETVYQQSRPQRKFSSSANCPGKKLPDMDQSGVPKGSVRLVTITPKRALRWPFPDAETSEGGGYRFYWDEWADNVPVCQTVDDIFTLCDTFVNVIGVSIGQDAGLIAKLTSIGTKSMADDQSPANRSRWLLLLKRLLVPSLSLLETNSSVVDGVWTLLKQFPIHVRYNVYAEWYEGQTSRLEPMKKAFARTRLETLSTMKRLSLTNIPQMAKTLAKTAYPSPGIVCKVALQQIESYSNLIEAFVECAKYFTDLGYDVLVWSVLSSLGGQQRSRTQESSVLLTSKWLQALSRFSGKVFLRYSTMDPTPILRYVDNQLSKGNSTDLVILKELISSMGGVISDLDFTDAQLHAMTGGELLRRETLTNLGDKRYVSTKSADRLIQALMTNGLAGRLLANIAQYRQSAISAVVQGDAHIKYLATMADDTHQVLLQYLDLLRSSLDGETFNNLVPSVIRLMRDYGLGAGLAFLIGRASIRTAMNRVRGQSESHAPAASAAPDTDGDVTMTTANGDDAANTPAADGQTTVSAQGANERKVDPVLEPFQPVIDEILTVLSEDTLRYLTPTCYVLFWALQLGDLSFPQDNYSDEINRLKRLAREVMNDRSDMTRNGINKKTQKQAEINARVSSLLKENSEELQRYSKFRFQLSRQLTTWFPADMTKVKATADTMLEECILPRLQLSGLDAEYSFRFLKFLHEFSAPNFQLMAVYDRLFQHNRLRSMLFTCTVREAEHIGRFLKCILSELSRWHGDKNAYEKEALGSKEVQKEKKDKTRNYVGFATAFDADGKPTEFVEHDAFRERLFQWHKELNSALRACLNDVEWMHIRNAITVLKAVIDFFPAITFMADKFLEQLKTITEREAASKIAPESEGGHRVDLSVTAQTAFSELQKRKSKWILVQAFRPGITGDSKEEGKSQRAAAVTAKDNSHGQKHTAAEDEDGEVKDNRSGRSGAASGNQKDSAPSRNLPTREPQKDVNPPPRSMGGNGPPPRPPAPNASPLPTKLPGNRNDANRPSTLNSGGRGLPSNPDLPRRPDVPIPEVFSAGHFNRAQHNINNRREAPPSRDSRDAREPRETRDPRETYPRETREPAHGRDNRDHRAQETSRPERPRDFPSADRRPAEPSTRDSSRLTDRDWPNRAEPQPRWTEPAAAPGRDGRQPRERTPHGASRHDGRLSRENAGAAPSAAAPSHNDAPEPPINPERARLLAEAEQKQSHPTPPRAAEPQHSHINPARAALITDVREPQGRTSSRDQTRERPPRTESPRASERSTTSQADNARDDRQGRHRHSDYHITSRDSHGHGESSHGRLDRPAEIERPGGSRDGSYNQPPSRGADHDHSRPGQQDPNYGRLNPIQSIVDSGPAPVPAATSGSGGPPPSGPRGRGRNNARMGPANGVPIRPDGRFPGMEANRTSSPDRQPPTGPSSSRQSRRGQFDNAGGNVNTPSSSLPTQSPGVHPDRMGHINQQAQQGAQSSQQQSQAGPSLPPPPPPSAPGVHPDRLNQINPDRLNQINGPPGHRPIGPSAHNRPPINTPDRPSMSAPNNSGRQQPSGQHVSNFATPTGPSAANNDRMRSGGGSRQLRGIQNMLDKASMDARGPGSRMRGSSRLNTMVDSDAQVLAGASPGNTPVNDRPDPLRDIRESGSRREMSTDRGDRERDRGRDTRARESRDREPRGGLAPIQVVGDSREDSSSVPHGSHSRSDVNGEGYGSSSRGGASGDHERGSSRHHSSRSERSDRPSRRSSRERNPGGGGGDGKESSSRGDYSRESRSRGGGGGGSGGGSGGPSTANAPGGPSADLITGGSSRDRRSGRDSNAGSGSGHRGGGGDMPPPPPSREPSHRGHGSHRGGGDGSSHNQGGAPPMGGGRSDGHGRPPRESRSSRPSGPGGGHDDMRGGGGDDRSRKRRGDGVIDSSQGLGGHQDKRPRR